MFCKKCGTESLDGVKFCKSCGSSLIAISNAESSQSNAKSTKTMLEWMGVVGFFGMAIKMGVVGFYPSEWPLILGGYAIVGVCMFISTKIKIEE